MIPVEVHEGNRHLEVSLVTSFETRLINVLVTVTERDAGERRPRQRLGLSMSRENAEVIRDALTYALEVTKPRPSKAERIRELLAVYVSPHARPSELMRMRDDIHAILVEDGDL